MDLSSVFKATVDVVEAVNLHMAIISNDATKSFKSLKAQLESTSELLKSLREVIDDSEDLGDASASIPLASGQDEVVAITSQPEDRSIMRLIKNDGQLEHLQKTLEGILTWINTLEKSKSKIPLSRILLLSSKAQQKKIQDFSFELEKFKITANLVLTMALKYEFQSTR